MRNLSVLLAVLAVALCGCSGVDGSRPTASASVAVTRAATASPGSATASAVAADAIDVTSYPAADFASPDGSIRCSLTSHDATCNFPDGMKRAGVPGAAKICPGAPLKVTGVTVSGLAEFFCSNGNDAHPEKKGSAAVWARAAGVPTVMVGTSELVTLPDGRTMVHGHLSCGVDGAAVTCTQSQTKAAFTISASGVKLTAGT